MASGRKCFTVKWYIENFSFLWEKDGKRQHSPEFLVESLEDTKWRLRLHPKSGPTVDYISFKLLREVEDDGPKKIALYYELSFLAKDGSAVKSATFTEDFRNETVSSGEVYLKKDDVLEDNKEELLPQDILTVCCKMWKIGTVTLKEGLCSLRTVVGVHRKIYDGIIKRFSTLMPSIIRTVHFTSVASEISILPFCVYVTNEGIIYMQNKVFSMDICKLYAINLFIIDSSSNKNHCKQKLKWKTGYNAGKTPLRIDLTLKDLIEDKEKFLPNDVLTLQYEEAISTGIESEKIEYESEVSPEIPPGLSDMKKPNISETKSKSVNAPERPLSEQNVSNNLQCQVGVLSTFKNDMKTLYNDRCLSDIMICTDTEEFPAHKSILSVRSPVFRRMLSIDMKEKTSECVNISDLSSDTVRRMLLFLYMDFVEELDFTSAKELYFAADKYDIISLKHRCSLCMQQNLCLSNVCEVLFLADMHQDQDLKSAVHDYIQKNDKKVFASEEWKLFMEKNSYLAAHVMHISCMKK